MSRKGTCVTNKKIYATEALAEEALIEAHVQFDFSKGGGPVAVYCCTDCGYFHLTSKGVLNKKLSTYLSSGMLDKQKEANRWIEKLKRK